ncbi:MAG: alpha-glucuronidase [Bacteroidales bacterium]|nr:alpha-glucuronidase [Bacteroidales bacterium]
MHYRCKAFVFYSCDISPLFSPFYPTPLDCRTFTFVDKISYSLAMKKWGLISFMLMVCVSIWAEDGYKLWLRYNKKDDKNKEYYSKFLSSIMLQSSSPIGKSIKEEIEKGCYEMLTSKPEFVNKFQEKCLLIISTPDNYPSFKKIFQKELSQINQEGYIIRNIKINNHRVIAITSLSESGLLYGVFHLLKLINLDNNLDNINIVSSPKIQYRVLNHWDNPDGSIERGYAGTSLWYGKKKIDTLRIIDYARANASLGINTVVINNVNASPSMLSDTSILFTASLANIFRKYGIKTMMSINFSTPKYLGGLSNSDPLNPEVIGWWREKIAEIYSIIPDFAGFLVKANSEGLPGPQDYGRTHADGANMLARLLKPYGGIVVWRAFVYSPSNEDRAKQGYNEFVPLDGKFLDNVVIQVKNGPIDFQPREPFHPLFGALQKTNIGMEFQITQEYLGFSTHLVYLAPLYTEVLKSDTYAKGKGSTVGKIIDGSIFPQKITLMAGVANTGSTINWCGHHFGQANWYAFGRLAWDYTLSAEQIASEWIKLTFTRNDTALKIISDIMLGSHEAAVNYMTPMGLHHLMAYEHHYGPQPWLDTAARPDWNSVYYHRADSIGLGFDRTSRGSNAVAQYFPPLNQIFDNLESCPQKYLLWFHHVPWNYKLGSGRSLWDELCLKYNQGVESVVEMQNFWQKIQPYIDNDRFVAVNAKLSRQVEDARWWKEACLLYFQTFSRMPFPSSIEPINNTLEFYQKKKIIPPYE